MGAEHAINGHKLYRAPLAGRENKFVITENEAWFLAYEDNANAPRLSEILAWMLRINLSDGEAVAEVDTKLEDGRILLGYVSREGNEVSVHLPPDSRDASVYRRLEEVFGTGFLVAVKIGTQAEVPG